VREDREIGGRREREKTQRKGEEAEK